MRGEEKSITTTCAMPLFVAESLKQIQFFLTTTSTALTQGHENQMMLIQ